MYKVLSNQISQLGDSIHTINQYLGVEKKVRDSEYRILDRKIETLPASQKAIKFALEKKLQTLNTFIVNVSMGAIGSGVVLKYNDKLYVLSAGHMGSENDKIALFKYGKFVCQLEVVKREYTTTEDDAEFIKGDDLLLLRPKNVNFTSENYAELADNEPLTASEVYIVGNPNGVEDVLSVGRVAVYRGNFMYFRDSIHFGNSGGGIYNNEGKLIGIMSHLIPSYSSLYYPPFVLGGAVRLDAIKAFLADVK